MPAPGKQLLGEELTNDVDRWAAAGGVICRQHLDPMREGGRNVVLGN